MSRPTGWPERLIGVVNNQRRPTPAEWGKSDCFTFVQDAITAVTGERPYHDVVYDSGVAAGRRLKERGFNSVAEALSAFYPDVSVPLAQRGDIGFTAEGAPVVFEGSGAVGRGDAGLVRVPREQVIRALAVR